MRRGFSAFHDLPDVQDGTYHVSATWVLEQHMCHATEIRYKQPPKDLGGDCTPSPTVTSGEIEVVQRKPER